jgi:hypothetical protein
MHYVPLYIFDLDGTLADTAHRQHLLNDKDDPNRWRKFYAACVDDLPHRHIIEVMEALKAANCEVWIWSGRSDEVEKETIDWICKHTSFTMDTLTLKMRKAGDFTPDDVLKKSWWMDVHPDHRSRVLATFDDRDRMVKMWRDMHVPCLQVAYGDF